MSDCIELRVDRWVQTELGLRAEFGTGYADPGFARLVKGCGYTRVVCHFDQAQVVRVGRELTGLCRSRDLDNLAHDVWESHFEYFAGTEEQQESVRVDAKLQVRSLQSGWSAVVLLTGWPEECAARFVVLRGGIS